MSGLIVGFGRPDSLKIEEMFARIHYRGLYLYGIITKNRAIMAQNYLRADCPEAHPENDPVPVNHPGNKNSSICYDGQMGNSNDLCNTHGITQGPFKEERLILLLFKKYGHKMLPVFG